MRRLLPAHRPWIAGALTVLLAAGIACVSSRVRVASPRPQAERWTATTAPPPVRVDRPSPSRASPAPGTTMAAVSGSGSGLPSADIRVNQDPTARFQNEPAVAIDPSDSQRLAAAWLDNEFYDPLTNLQRSRVAVGWSADGGRTWQSDVPEFPSLTNAQTADPSLAFDGVGNVFLAFLPYDQFDRSDPGLNQVVVARSTDGGRSYGAPVVVDAGGVDKPYLATDPTTQAVYVFWVRFSVSEESIRVSHSDDHGASFTSPAAVSSASSPGTGPAPGVGPDGTVYVAWSNRGDTIWFDRSSDGGVTWLASDVAVNASVVPPQEPLLGELRNPPFPALAVDRSSGPFSGRIYVAWPDLRFGDPDILLAWSSDHGSTWSAPVRVHGDVPGNGADQFFPWVAVDGSGDVHVTFLDRRDDPSGSRISIYVATSTDGGASFARDIRVSDGGFPPTEPFYGDYTGSAASDSRLLALWPDSRAGDQDVFTHRLDTTDYDEDGVPNDGDNCSGAPNPDQNDSDADGVGDACDDCPGASNPGQEDSDRDGTGDACDPCIDRVGSDGGDPDGDGIVSCADDCPTVSNAGQDDADGDGIGDPCDPCPGDSVNDPDGDGRCATQDNCPERRNPLQVDDDADGLGNACDACPTDPDPLATDTDGDAVDDVCDCQPLDPNDRPPGEVRGVRAFRTSAGARYSWRPTGPDDVYSVSRGLLSNLGSGAYGPCLAEGVDSGGFEDGETPPPGDGFFYLVSGQNFECGLGAAGLDADEAPRLNTDPAACIGADHSDVHAQSEQTVYGTVVAGSLASTTSSDDVVESIREEVVGGLPSTRYTRLEHRWTFDVPAGSRVELHVEYSQSASPDGDAFFYEYATDGMTFDGARLISSAFTDDADKVYELPDGVSGTLVVRVLDTQRTPGTDAGYRDTVSIDEIFIRSVP